MRDIPIHLDTILTEALTVMRHNPEHTVPPGHRRSIYDLLGERGSVHHLSMTSGQYRRAWLSLHTIKHGVPLWNQIYPQHDLLQRIITEIERRLQHQVSSAQALSHYELLMNEALVLPPESETVRQNIQLLCLGALRAYMVSIDDEFFTATTVPDHMTDQEIDPDLWDTAFYVAAAFANGGPWDNEADADKRQQFWVWWLTDAVPQAWAALPEGRA